MLFAIEKNEQLIKSVISNLRPEDELEMQKEFGENWFDIVFEKTMYTDADVKIIVDECNTPVALFGVKKVDKDTAEICLLSTSSLKNNSTYFLLRAGKTIAEWKTKYKRLENYVYKFNTTIIKWLSLLGFNLIEADKDRLYFWSDNG